MPTRGSTSLDTRFGYAAADGAVSLVWTVTSSYLLVFYLDVAQLPAAAVGTLFLAVRLTDAFSDVGIGLAVDRTRTRWGRSRPYLLMTSIPLGALAVLTFSSPDWTSSGRLAWAYCSYLAFCVAYSFASIPLVSILSRLSPRTEERMTLSVWKTAGNALGSIAGGAAFLPLVAWFAQGDDARGYLCAALLAACLVTLALLFGFATLRERTETRGTQTGLRPPPFRALRGNTPLLLGAAFALVLNVGTAPRVAAAVLFFRDHLDRGDLIPAMNLCQAGLFAGLAASAWSVRRLGKRNTLLVSVLLQAAMVALPLATGQSATAALLSVALASVASGAQLSTLIAVLADIVDFGEWRTGVRAEGLIAALATLAVKTGIAFGSALTGWLLAASGYVTGAPAQSSGVSTMILVCYSILPAAALLVCAGLLAWYRLDRLLPAIRRDLETRSAAAPRPLVEA